MYISCFDFNEIEWTADQQQHQQCKKKRRQSFCLSWKLIKRAKHFKWLAYTHIQRVVICRNFSLVLCLFVVVVVKENYQKKNSHRNQWLKHLIFDLFSFNGFQKCNLMPNILWFGEIPTETTQPERKLIGLAKLFFFDDAFRIFETFFVFRSFFSMRNLSAHIFVCECKKLRKIETGESIPPFLFLKHWHLFKFSLISNKTERFRNMKGSVPELLRKEKALKRARSHNRRNHSQLKQEKHFCNFFASFSSILLQNFVDMKFQTLGRMNEQTTKTWACNQIDTNIIKKKNNTHHIHISRNRSSKLQFVGGFSCCDRPVKVTTWRHHETFTPNT